MIIYWNNTIWSLVKYLFLIDERVNCFYTMIILNNKFVYTYIYESDRDYKKIVTSEIFVCII